MNDESRPDHHAGYARRASKKKTVVLCHCWRFAVVWRAFSTLSLAWISAYAQSNGLQNYSFERGDITGWAVQAQELSVRAGSNTSFNHNWSARFSGLLRSSTNVLHQTVIARRGDLVEVSGFVRSSLPAGAQGRVEVRLDGPWNMGGTVFEMPLTVTDWTRFQVSGMAFGVTDGGFESPCLSPTWTVHADNATVGIVTNSGRCLQMRGSWTKWSWNEAYQDFPLVAGETVAFGGKCFLEALQTSGNNSWIVAGFKLESMRTNILGREAVLKPGALTNRWVGLSTNWVIPETGVYRFRAMLCGTGTVATGSAYFDDMFLVKALSTNQAPDRFPVTLSLRVIGTNQMQQTPVDVNFDSLVLKGATTPCPDSDEAVFQRLITQAATMEVTADATNQYPPLGTFGNPGRLMGTTNMVFPSYSEVVLSGYQFRPLSTNKAPNSAVLWVTNTIEITPFEDGPAQLEWDCFQLLARNPNVARDLPALMDTNAPYFTIGQRDGSSAEFGSGPFSNDDQYYWVGVSQPTQFPKRLSTEGAGWPKRLHLVFQVPSRADNSFTNVLWNKHALIRTVGQTDSLTARSKAVKVTMSFRASWMKTKVTVVTPEVHMGGATEAAAFGCVDYENIWYGQAANVDLLSPWINNIVDENGWYAAGAPRASATIEPLEIWSSAKGQWIPHVCDEVLYNWSHAGAGVRSLWDPDSITRIPGQASYEVAVKAGHVWKTNGYGDTTYPQLLEARGNGYWRLATYGGAMGGSWRPLAQDVFGLWSGTEDFPLMPLAMVRVVPADAKVQGSYDGFRVLGLMYSKQNQAIAAAARWDVHGNPTEVEVPGVYMDCDTHVSVKRDLFLERDGPLGMAQSSMNWRSGSPGGIGRKDKACDISHVLCYNPEDGDWVRYRVMNPLVGIRQTSLGNLRPGGSLYLLNQDRETNSYGFYPEVPYNFSSSFQLTLLSADANLPFQSAVTVSHTDTEVNDNVVISAHIARDLAQGEHAHYQYRYRVLKSPGVEILRPVDPAALNSSTGTVVQLEAQATEEHRVPMLVDFFYGIGKDGNWVKINSTSLRASNSAPVVLKWNTTNVPPGAYYIKATARRANGTNLLAGFDVSGARLMVGGYALVRDASPGTWRPVAPATSVNLATHSLLGIWLSNGAVANGKVVVTDTAGATNSVALADYAPGGGGLPCRVDIPWTAFPTVNRARIRRVTLQNLPAAVQALGIRSYASAVLVRSEVTGSAVTWTNGVALANPGETVTNVISIRNLGPATNLSLRLFHEYAETTGSYSRGDRLAGTSEFQYSLGLAEKGLLRLTNIYQLPLGRTNGDIIALRNDAGFAQVRASIRASTGQVLWEHDRLASYLMDDDWDINNDGLPDAFEISHYGSRVSGADAQADPDGDGLSNLEEAASGRDPAAPDTRRLSMSLQKSSHTNGTVIVFDSIPGRWYSLFETRRLPPSWQPVMTFAAAAPSCRITNQEPDREQTFYSLLEHPFKPFAGLINGGFEEAVLKPWRMTRGPIDWSISTDKVRSGKHSLRIQAQWFGPLTNSFEQEYEVRAGDHLTCAAWVYADRVESADQNLALGIQKADLDRPLAAAPVSSLLGGWHLLSFRYQATSNQLAKFVFFVSGGKSNTVTRVSAYLDDLAVVKDSP